MASPCELLCEVDSEAEADKLATTVADEAWRIEDKLSRYLSGNIIDRINSAAGTALEVDAETAQLINFAVTLFSLSEGAFDITSGVLRRAWRFDGSNNIPTKSEVAELLPLLGWHKVTWSMPTLTLPEGMEIDLGGIGKEYAVDRCIQLLQAQTKAACLVNFGGDLAVTGAPLNRKAWSVGIEPAAGENAVSLVELRQGALATSGDARRYLEKDGVRYSHVLDPRTGWPVLGAAASVTVAANTCTQAGMLATLAMLRGADAEAFLVRQTEQYWCRRSR